MELSARCARGGKGGKQRSLGEYPLAFFVRVRSTRWGLIGL